MYTNHRSPAWALALMKSLVLSLLFLSIVTANTPTTQQTISQPNTNTNNINATSTTYYTEIAIKNTLPVSLKNIRFAHISNQELNVRTWDNVQSGQTLPPVPIKYATGIFSGSDKWNLDITFEDGETFYIDRDSSCNLEESDSGESYTWTIEGVNFDMPMNSDGMNTRISNNDNADEFNDYAFARVRYPIPSNPQPKTSELLSLTISP
ncbi:hypothetical protein BO71DRAFT_137916 [Aspergillus ellipticus CBS 707.79]|uniref:Up-regulated in Daf-2 domain-containing protein n=1 Tax=Aspergillus ellipticus CBS 707.79 TaxID=1448320 RepID=A0A319EG57_9EURO|nr:hypothetical protein BO71DRAFT_137916 [Aspergillus ellipticus CBS 707.79]